MNKESHSVSMRDIAQEAGVHVTTVSLALRNSPKLRQETRQRIQEVARRMGYRPNPLVVALVQQRRNSSSKASLAFVSRMPPDAKLANRKYIDGLYKHVAIRAQELGFNIDTFDLAEYADNAQRLQKTLRHRNIHGIIIAPLPHTQEELNFDWSQLAVVAIGHSLVLEGVDRVCTDYYGGSWMAMEHCEAEGYRRAGFVTLRSTDERTQGRWRGGFMAYIPKRKSFQSLPPFVGQGASYTRSFKAWLREHKPDVILGNSLALEASETGLRALSESERPDLVRLNIHTRANPMKGIYTGVEMRSRLAVDLLSAKLYRNEVGTSESANEMLTPTLWHPGAA